MPREKDFTCSCGVTEEQSVRGAKKMRCKECRRKVKQQANAANYLRRKAKEQPQAA